MGICSRVVFVSKILLRTKLTCHMWATRFKKIMSKGDRLYICGKLSEHNIYVDYEVMEVVTHMEVRCRLMMKL